jgi:hypothetical protein
MLHRLDSSISLGRFAHPKKQGESMIETAFNHIYVGGVQDILVYRRAVIFSQNPMSSGMIRASINMEKQLQLLLHTEYAYKIGMFQQTYLITPYVGIRKRF